METAGCMKGKTLYISDLDGTLLNSSCRVSADSAAILNRLIADGALFTVATARTPATVSSLMRDVAMRLPAVVMTGAALWDAATGIYSACEYIPQDTVAEMIDVYRHYKFPTFIYKLENGIINIYHYSAMSPHEQAFMEERINNPLKHFETQKCRRDGMPLTADNVLLFYAMQPDTPTRSIYDKLKTMNVRALSYHDIYGEELAITEVFSPRVSKAAAASRLAASVGATRTVAFGDNINDIPLMQAADVAVAVGNAVDAVRQAADIVIEDHDTDSVARFIAEDFSNHDNTL